MNIFLGSSNQDSYVLLIATGAGVCVGWHLPNNDLTIFDNHTEVLERRGWCTVEGVGCMQMCYSFLGLLMLLLTTDNAVWYFYVGDEHFSSSRGSEWRIEIEAGDQSTIDEDFSDCKVACEFVLFLGLFLLDAAARW